MHVARGLENLRHKGACFLIVHQFVCKLLLCSILSLIRLIVRVVLNRCTSDSFNANLLILFIYSDVTNGPIFHVLLAMRNNFPVVCEDGFINVTLDTIYNKGVDRYYSFLVRGGLPELSINQHEQVIS